MKSFEIKPSLLAVPDYSQLSDEPRLESVADIKKQFPE